MENTAVVIADAAGVIRFWNRGAENAFGHACEQAVGQTLDLIVPPEYRQAHWTGFRKAIASGTAAVEGQNLPFPALRAGGQISATQGRLTLLRAPNGSVIGAVVVFTQDSGTEPAA